MTRMISREDAKMQLSALISRILGNPKISMSESTTLNCDFRIGGDDAAELLEEIHRQFGTAFDGFIFKNYFPNESDAFFEHIASIIGFKNRKRRSLSVSHMLDVIESGRWFDPPHDL